MARILDTDAEAAWQRMVEALALLNQAGEQRAASHLQSAIDH